MGVIQWGTVWRKAPLINIQFGGMVAIFRRYAALRRNKALRRLIPGSLPLPAKPLTVSSNGLLVPPVRFADVLSV